VVVPDFVPKKGVKIETDPKVRPHSQLCVDHTSLLWVLEWYALASCAMLALNCSK